MLSARLETIASLIPLGASVADVGSDHASVPLRLLAEQSVAFVQGIENKPGPFKVMKTALEKAHPSGSYSLSLSDGLSKADPRVDTAVLAGLGGKLIATILQRDLPVHPGIRTIIVDPHSERPFSYRALMELGFREEASRSLYEEGHYYEVSRWVKSPTLSTYSDVQLEFGPVALREKPYPWRKYWESEIVRLQGIISSLSDNQETKKEALIHQIKHIEEALQ
jgi:Predicted SAM-dependent methyltransferase